MKGQRESQWHLAYAYEAGEGVARDDVAAYVWYRCADASFHTIPPVDAADADMARDLKASIARIQADDLAGRHIENFSAGRTRD